MSQRVLQLAFRGRHLSGVAERTLQRTWLILSRRNRFLLFHTRRLMEEGTSIHNNPSPQRARATEVACLAIYLGHPHPDTTPWPVAARVFLNGATLNARHLESGRLPHMAHPRPPLTNHLRVCAFPGGRPLQVPCLQVLDLRTSPLPPLFLASHHNP